MFGLLKCVSAAHSNKPAAAERCCLGDGFGSSVVRIRIPVSLSLLRLVVSTLSSLSMLKYWALIATEVQSTCTHKGQPGSFHYSGIRPRLTSLFWIVVPTLRGHSSEQWCFGKRPSSTEEGAMGTITAGRVDPTCFYSSKDSSSVQKSNARRLLSLLFHSMSSDKFRFPVNI